MAAVAAGAACVVVAACQGASGQASAPAASGKPSASASAAAGGQLTIAPDSGNNVNPGKGVTVTSTTAMHKLTVMAGKHALPGHLNAAGKVWRSSWALKPSRAYSLSASGVSSAGKTVTASSKFRTLTPAATDAAQTFEGYHQTYGVGMPIAITFSSPVTHKAAVERSLEIHTSKPVTGAWYWDGNQALDFRPMNYWPANTTVSFTAHLDGVQASAGTYFTSNLSQSFTIGQSLITVASTTSHYMKVYWKGKEIGNWPISTGQPGDDTANGTYLTIEKANPTRMVGHGYNVMVPYAVRFTWSGNYIHDAYWSVAQQGHINVSHGCVNVSPAHSVVYYRHAVPGDPVTVTGSPVAGKWDDGWTEWFLNWKHLVAGNALHMAVQAGPSGSTFVNPSSVQQKVKSTVLHGSKPYNYLAK
jgi:lipoprotein-anchoring transpeptidase ErfK/SrfK